MRGDDSFIYRFFKYAIRYFIKKEMNRTVCRPMTFHDILHH